jgi:hypothetical protein
MYTEGSLGWDVVESLCSCGVTDPLYLSQMINNRNASFGEKKLEGETEVLGENQYNCHFVNYRMGDL